MHISYEDQTIREYCSSLKPNVNKTPFTIDEIVQIRAYIEDLRSAPRLSDVPINDKIIEESKGQNRVIIQFDEIKIICVVISSISNPTPKQIRRVQVKDIIRTDLQLENSNINNV